MPRRTTVDDQFGVPTFIASPPISRGTLGTLRYRSAVFLTAGKRVYGYLVTDRGAATRRGVAVGDSLARARDRYPELKCGTTAGDSESEAFPYCAGRLGRLYVSFGLDPIGSIIVSQTRLQP